MTRLTGSPECFFKMEVTSNDSAIAARKEAFKSAIRLWQSRATERHASLSRDRRFILQSCQRAIALSCYWLQCSIVLKAEHGESRLSFHVLHREYLPLHYLLHRHLSQVTLIRSQCLRSISLHTRFNTSRSSRSSICKQPDDGDCLSARIYILS